jgi:putative effector of murein hydrolase LrgA (UPF0299 family)
MTLSMTKNLRILSIPAALGALLAFVGLTIGWNLVTLFIFWFLLLPILGLNLPRWISRTGNQLIESIAGVFIFYTVIVFMIYEHYQTDYFQVMIVSFFFNVVVIIAKSKRTLTQTSSPEI